MSTLVKHKEPMAIKIYFKDNKLYVLLDDNREIGVPLEWFPKLNTATDKQRENYQLIGDGLGIHFPDIDEDISVAGLLR